MDFENFDSCNDGNSVYENAMRKIEEAKRYKPRCCCLQGPTGPTGPSGGPTGPTGSTGATGPTGPTARLVNSSNK